MKKSAIMLAPAVLALAGCGGPSCDGGKALDAVRAVSDSNDTQLKSAMYYKISPTIYTKEGAEFKKITEKVQQDGERLNKILASCGQKSSFGIDPNGVEGNEYPTDHTGYYHYDQPGKVSRELIDQEALCKPTIPAGEIPSAANIEGDEAFHKANITPAAYALADDINLWFAMRAKATEAHREATNEKIKGFKLTLENIIMTFKDSTTGSVSCKATAVGHLDGLNEDAHRDITYTIEKTTSGDFIATVQGL